MNPEKTRYAAYGDAYLKDAEAAILDDQQHAMDLAEAAQPPAQGGNPNTSRANKTIATRYSKFGKATVGKSAYGKLKQNNGR